MRVSIVCHDLSSGACLSALAVADALADSHEVEIVGAQFGARPWPALSESRHRVHTISGSGGASFFFTTLPRLYRSLVGDVVVCCKVRFPSLAPALLRRFLSRVPVVLYVDDDEIALTLPGRSRRWYRRISDPAGDIYTVLSHRMSRFASAVVSDTEAMKRIYGGSVVPLPRDLANFDPSRVDGSDIRREYGLREGDLLVGFIGVPRTHKGIDDLLEAARLANVDGMKILIVPPIGFEDPELRLRLAEESGRILYIEGQPSSRVPALLAACDVVAIPQRRTAEAEGQLPAKLGEAMAMGKAIVSTNVSDIPLYLEDCGILVPPGDPAALARALRSLASNETLRRDLGKRARAAYLQRLSLEALGPRLRAVIENAARSS